MIKRERHTSAMSALWKTKQQGGLELLCCTGGPCTEKQKEAWNLQAQPLQSVAKRCGAAGPDPTKTPVSIASVKKKRREKKMSSVVSDELS